MSRVFAYETTIRPEWIDYNGHMRDAFYGLIFSQAVDAIQDEVGFDAAYRARTGCTIYLIEEHRFFLHEVREGARVRVLTRVLGCDAKRFHLWSEMLEGDTRLAVAELVEIHVNQHPKPHGELMPDEIRRVLERATVGEEEQPSLTPRARALSLRP